MFWGKSDTTPSVEKSLTSASPGIGMATAGVPKSQLHGLISHYKTESEDGAFASFLNEFKVLLN